jgi:hypothetical protein
MAAMSLLKGDAMNHRTVNHRTTGRATAANVGFSKSGTETKSSAKQAFVEDFNMEHSSSNVSVKLKAFSATAEAMESGASRNSYVPSKALPSCVYLG